MKKIQYMTFLMYGLMLASCSDEVSLESGGAVVSTTQVAGAITFSTEDGNLRVGGTRAEGAISSNDELHAAGFGVFACHHGQHPYSSSNVSSNFMWNQQVTWHAGSGKWKYEPMKYWPQGDGDEDNREYLSFFAYGPYAEANETGCVTDFSNNKEVGDPWLVYQLGGSRDSWQSAQKDLLYAFAKDQQQPSTGGEITTSRINLNFRHALAGAGDEISVAVSSDLQAKLKEQAAAAGREVSLILDRIILNYTLVRKGKLVLNSSDTPNWQSIESEDPMIHRVLTLTPNDAQKVLATAANGSTCTVNDCRFTGQGIFYIPLSLKGQEQTVDIMAQYHTSEGYVASVGNTIALTAEDMDSRSQGFALKLFKLPVGTAEDMSIGMRILDIDDQTYSGSPLMPAVIVVSSEGQVLTQGTDYTLTYADNLDVPVAGGDRPSASAVGIGDYQGKMAKKLFNIRQAIGAVNFTSPTASVALSGDPGSPATLTNALANSGDGQVVFSSSNTAVATVDANSGVVTAVGEGNTVIFATVSDGRNYTYPVKTVSFYLTVTAAP